MESHQPELFLWHILQIHPNIPSLKHVLLLPQHLCEAQSGNILLLGQIKIYRTWLEGGAPWDFSKVPVYSCVGTSCHVDMLWVSWGHQDHGGSPGESEEPPWGFCFYHLAGFPPFVPLTFKQFPSFSVAGSEARFAAVSMYLSLFCELQVKLRCGCKTWLTAFWQHTPCYVAS